MRYSCLLRVLYGVGVAALCWNAPGYAATVYDLNTENDIILPSIVGWGNAPVYVTNTLDQGDGDAAAARVETMRIGEKNQFNIGFAPDAVAAGAVEVNVAKSMLVEGLVRMGKEASYHEQGMPDSATTQASRLTVGSALTVANGGMVIASGVTDGESEENESADAIYSEIHANSVALDGGSMILGKFSTLATGATPDSLEENEGYGIAIRNGGMLQLNGGVPDVVLPATGPDDDDGDAEVETTESAMRVREPEVRNGGPASEDASRMFQNYDESEWAFKGANVSEGGRGVLVDRGGALSAGRAGGVLLGAAGQTLEVRSGGTLDASRGTLVVGGIDTVAIDGTYRAGYNQDSGTTTHLVALDAETTFAGNAKILLSRDLQRRVNADGVNAGVDPVLLRAAAIQFDGGTPVIQGGMGTYGLEVDRGSSESGDYLRIGWVANQVLGNSTDGDKEQFRNNMSAIWRGAMKRDQAENIYSLTAVEQPRITAYSDAGRFNQGVLEAMVDGYGADVEGAGVVDQGVYEMYNLSSLWGVTSAQLGTADAFMSRIDRRVERIGAEMDRLGLASPYATETVYEGVDMGYGSLSLHPEYLAGRVWAGGFGHNEKVEQDFGAGYTYRPRGVAAGYDRNVGRLSLGVAGAYGRGDYEDGIALENDSKITSYSAGVYGSYHGCGGLFVSGQATYSHFENDIADIRGGMRRTADHTGYAWTLGAKLGFDKLLTNRIMLTPSVGVNRARSGSRAHDEYLNGLSVLAVGEMRRDSFMTPVEIGMSVDLVRNPGAVLRLTGTAGYAYDFYDGALDGIFNYSGLTNAVAMEAAERNPGRNRVNLGAGLTLTARRLDVSARYDYFHRSRQKTHQAQGSLGVKF